MFGLPEKIVIFDLECTTWEGAATRSWSGPGEHRELVKIAAALVETSKSFREIRFFMSMVRPRINPFLSDYFINLTGITQEELDKEGRDFAAVLSDFCVWCENYPLYTYDHIKTRPRIFDRDVLEENCRLYGLTFPFDKERFHNIHEVFYRHGIELTQSGRAPEAFGIQLPALPHDAMNDVMGLIIGLRALAERQETPR